MPPSLDTSTTSSTPAVVSILGGTTPEVIVPTAVTSTWTPTSISIRTVMFPSPAVVSTSTVVISHTDTTGAATAPSLMSLSDGLGPLLSSKSTTTVSRSLGVTLSVLPDSVGSSKIQVIQGTLTPTAASSHLTTSGVPESLSVNLSLVSFIPDLVSSAALISFGTSSPAVYSTVLPPGASLGTSSQTLTTYSTIALSGALLTGVTLLAPRSPTSCFTLPTPSALMDMLAVAVVPMGDYDLSNPMILAFGDNGTTPQYVSVQASGNPYILNLSPHNNVMGQLGLQIPGEEALVFDGSGMHLYTGNCSSLTEVLVDNFYHQLSSMAGAPSGRAAMSKLQVRQSLGSGNFTVEVAIDSYLIDSSSPNLTFGETQCAHQFNTKDSKSVNITWSCVYPPPTAGVSTCALNLDAWLNDMTVPSTHPRNTTEVLATLGPFLSLAGDSILDLFPGSDPALGLGFVYMRQVESAAKIAVGGAGDSACAVLHAFDSHDLVLVDSGPLGTQTIGSYMTDPPPSVGVNLAATATSVITGLPRRQVNPTDNFLHQIATDFKSIFGAFTAWLHGLPHLTLGFEETGTLLPEMILTNPVVTITSTSSLATPSVVHIQIPTVTVTHVMGDGWFIPSTYVVRPGTTAVPQFPALSADAPGSSTTRSTRISLEEYMNFASSSSTPTYASSNLVDYVVAQLAAMDLPDAGVQSGHRWDLPNPQDFESSTTTTGTLHGYGGHVVVFTTTVYLSNVNHQD